MSSYEAWQSVYLGRHFLDVSAWFGADDQLMADSFIELALQLQRERKEKKETKEKIEHFKKESEKWEYYKVV